MASSQLGMILWSSTADNGVGQGERAYTKCVCGGGGRYNPVSTSQEQLEIQTLGCPEPISAGR